MRQSFLPEFPDGTENIGSAPSILVIDKTYERIRDYFADQCAIPISAGSLFNLNKEAFGLLETFESIVVRQLIAQALLHADETGININGTLRWLHSVPNDRWSLFFPHPNRGGEAMKAMVILHHFGGSLCHDHWKP